MISTVIKSQASSPRASPSSSPPPPRDRPRRYFWPREVWAGERYGGEFGDGGDVCGGERGSGYPMENTENTEKPSALSSSSRASHFLNAVVKRDQSTTSSCSRTGAYSSSAPSLAHASCASGTRSCLGLGNVRIRKKEGGGSALRQGVEGEGMWRRRRAATLGLRVAASLWYRGGATSLLLGLYVVTSLRGTAGPGASAARRRGITASAARHRRVVCGAWRYLSVCGAAASVVSMSPSRRLLVSTHLSSFRLSLNAPTDISPRC
ncbi:hypothetical protein DFH09DRAFT_1489177 [Mycena vulgaris]|nr:hypothetical protein DFH09DRAFT_1489177 [Mycena vulgaris]